MDSENETKTFETCKRFVTLCINSIIQLKCPEIYDDFPDYPTDFPQKWLFQTPKKLEESSSSKTKNKRNNKGKQLVPKKEKLVVEELKNSESKRKRKFSGTYNVEKLFEEQFNPEQSDPADIKCSHSEIDIKDNNENVQKLQNFQTFVIKKHENKKTRIRTLSETSSDDMAAHGEFIYNGGFVNNLIISQDSKLNLSVKIPMCLIEKCDSLVNLPKKSLDSLEKLQTSNDIAFQKPPKLQECKALKSIFQESSSFDDAMQKYAEKKKELQKIVRPKIIPAPEQDPSVKKFTKKKSIKDKDTTRDESDSNKHLGGIFTINNGWDKHEDKKIEVEIENKKEVINKLERTVTPPKIVIDTNMEDVMAAHDEFMYNGDFMDNLIVSQDSITSFSTASSHSLQIALSNDKLEAENHNKNDNDVVSLFAEVGEFDDLEEKQFCAEVDPDDLKLKVQFFKRKIEPLNPQAEFDMNTKKISQNMADPETDKILKTYFANACPAFLESRCLMPDCQRNHFVPEELRIYPLLINATFDVLHKVYQVILKYHRLFQAYISILVEICVKNKDEKGLIELIKACDRIPRTVVCYKDIVRKLIELDFMKEHKAIAFIIAHHTDSEIARDTILSLILDSGPCITLFMDYIERAHIKKPIHSDMFNRILHTCVAYQNPKLPNFCLNYLQGLNAHQMKNLNSEHLKAFLQMNKCISELNENREAKALRITQTLLSAMDW